MAELNQQQFGITPHEHLGLLKHAYNDYEGPKDWEPEPGETHSSGQRERGRPYGPEDFQVLRVDKLPEPSKQGETHEVEISRGQRYHSIYGWNRDTDEKSLWMD